MIACFERFARATAPSACALYILGDLFDEWLGDDDRRETAERVCGALRELSANTPVFFMPGNHDFLPGDGFAKRSGCEIIPDPWVITLFQRTTILTHGDLLCTGDRAYLRYRRLIRRRGLQKCFLGLSFARRERIAAVMHKRLGADGKPVDVEAATVNAWLSKHGSDRMIHGHTHRRDVHDIVRGKKQQRAQRIVLGEWSTRGSALSLEGADDDAFRWLEFD